LENSPTKSNSDLLEGDGGVSGAENSRVLKAQIG
jgi:hypothetical protein